MIKERERRPLGHLPNLPGSRAAAQHCWPSPVGAPIVFNLLPVGRRACVRRARARAGHLMLAACSWTSLGAPRHPLGPLSLFLEAPPLCSLSLARTRTQPSPPTRTTAATGPPSPLRRAPELRRDVPVPTTEPQDAGRPVEPSPSLSSLPAAADRHRRRFAARRTSPSTPACSASPP